MKTSRMAALIFGPSIALAIIALYIMVFFVNKASDHELIALLSADPIRSAHDIAAKDAMLDLYRACSADGIGLATPPGAYASVSIDSSPIPRDVAERLNVDANQAVPHLNLFIGGTDTVAREALKTSTLARINELSLGLVAVDSRYASVFPPRQLPTWTKHSSRYDFLGDYDFHFMMVTYGSLGGGLFGLLVFVPTVFYFRRMRNRQASNA